MSVEIAPVASGRDRRVFRDLPGRLHGSDPCFVPMLRMALKAVLDRRKNPFWRNAEGCEWIARRNGEPVGRIGACRDGALFEREPGCGAVGFLDAVDDAEVARALFATALGWLRERDCTRARGPLNYSIHDTAGVLVEGFDTPPTIDTTWNPPYYDDLWQAAGWEGAQDMLGCGGEVVTGGPERVARFAERVRRRGYSSRPVDMKRFESELEQFRRVYNAAWADNWGHVPISEEEFRYKAKDMKAVLDPDLLFVAEFQGKVVGVFLGLPDLNVAIRKSGGKLFPLGWWRLLRSRKTAKRNRVLLLGVEPGHRNRGVEALILYTCYQAIKDHYPFSEASWVLEDNAAMMNGLPLYNLFPYKKWRVYETSIR